MRTTRSSVLRDKLYRAIVEGSLWDVQLLVEQGANLHTRFYKFRGSGTVLHVAAFYGHCNLLAFFLNEGLNVNVTDTKYRDTPLHLASEAGHAEVVVFLLDRKANMNAKNKLGRKPIHEAIGFRQKHVLQIFLKKGMNVQEAELSGETLLHKSCRIGELEAVQLLVNYKADIHAKDADGRKPIHIAAGCGHNAVVKYFLNLGMSIAETDKNCQTVLHLAVNNLKIVKLLVDKITTMSLGKVIDAQDNRGKTPLHLVSHEAKNVMNCLLDAGARSDIKDCNGYTVLFYFLSSHYYYDPDDHSILAKMHNFVDIDNRTKMTAAHVVVTDSDLDFIKLVLQHQKLLNIEDLFGKTPMNYLTRNMFESEIDRHETVIRMLVDHGAYFKVEDCKQIVQNRILKERLFTDTNFCSHYLVSKFDNIDLPMLRWLPSAISLSVLERLKLKSSQIRLIESAVAEEIQNKGHCDVSKMTPPLLSILAIESYISHYRNLYGRLFKFKILRSIPMY